MPGEIQGNCEGDRADLRGAAKWTDGHWHLELSGALKTGKQVRPRLRAGAATCACGSTWTTRKGPPRPARAARKRFNGLPDMHIDMERRAACQVLCRIGIGVAGALAFLLCASWVYDH